MEIPVTNLEMRTVREAMREMSGLLKMLQSGQLSKIVLTSRGQMHGVILSVEEYARLRALDNSSTTDS